MVFDSRQQIFLNTKAITQQDKNIWRRWEYRRIFGGSSFLIITTSSWHEFVMMTDKKYWIGFKGCPLQEHQREIFLVDVHGCGHIMRILQGLEKRDFGT